jgi:hypothetical protein
MTAEVALHANGKSETSVRFQKEAKVPRFYNLKDFGILRFAQNDRRGLGDSRAVGKG